MRVKRFRWDKKYLYWGLTAFFVIVASVLFFELITNLPRLSGIFSALITILSPFIWGLVIAYLLWPLTGLLQRNVFEPLARLLFDKKGTEEKIFTFSRALSVLFSIIAMIVALAAVLGLIVPRLIDILQTIVVNSQTYANTVYGWIERLLADYPELEQFMTATVGNVSESVTDWINRILPELQDFLGNVTSGVVSVVKGVYNVIIGMIVSVYLLYNKEVFVAHLRKLLYCIFALEASERIIKAVEFIDQVFIGFLSGKILDSFIIGVICYIGCLIMKIPYALLVSFIVCITNIIPFFGPFIGAVPSAIIILMEDPIKCLVFLVFVVVLQQLDGNVIGPKILGNSVGINGFWILFSIIVGTGLFGFIGMLLGVPVFVIIYTGIKALADRKLERSGLPTDTAYYRRLDYIDPETGEAVVKVEKRRRTGQKPRPREKKPKTGIETSEKQETPGGASGQAEGETGKAVEDDAPSEEKS